MRTLNLDLAPDGFTADTFIDTDEEVTTSIQSLPSDEEPLHHFTIENINNDNVEIIDDESDEMESKAHKQESVIRGNRLD